MYKFNLKQFFKISLVVIVFSSHATTHNPQQFLNNIRGSKNEGQQIVQEFCASCHNVKPLIEIGAPKIGVFNDWLPRIKHGFPLLIKHVEEGYGSMPARGGCFECSDLQLRLAVLSLLPKELKKALRRP